MANSSRTPAPAVVAKRGSKALADKTEDAAIAKVGLLEYVRMAMCTYGKYTLEQRAIPDYRDGLKPVHRRGLWGAFEMGLLASKGISKKSARIVGDVMGKYHPHGDAPVYDAIVNMTRNYLRNATIHGQGNFGTVLDKPGAMRYTEARLSEYSESTFFNSLYLPVIEKSDNFDGSEKEPVVLPACLPNLLLNGSFGIATGGKTGMCAYHAEGVIHLTKLAISGTPITPRMCLENLIPASAGGGFALFDEKDQIYADELLKFFSTGAGSVYWIPDTEIDPSARSLKVWGFSPQVAVSLETVLKRLANDDRVSDVIDESDLDENNEGFLSYRVIMRRGVVPAEDIYDELLDLQGYFEGKQHMMFAINERTLNDNDETDAEFEVINMPEFFSRWAKYRIELERKAIDYQIEQIEKKIARDEMLLLAVINREVIIKALDREDTEQYLVKTLKITMDQVKLILDLRVRQLKKLEGDDIKRRISSMKSEIETLEAEYVDPVQRIHSAIDVAAAEAV